MKVCNVNGCPTIFKGTGGRCPEHALAARRSREGNKVYGSKGHRAFRNSVLTRDTVCVECNKALATVADHYPRQRTQLVDEGLNPNDPQYGRGLCARCHNTWTAATTASGFRAL